MHSCRDQTSLDRRIGGQPDRGTPSGSGGTIQNSGAGFLDRGTPYRIQGLGFGPGFCRLRILPRSFSTLARNSSSPRGRPAFLGTQDLDVFLTNHAGEEAMSWAPASSGGGPSTSASSRPRTCQRRCSTNGVTVHLVANQPLFSTVGNIRQQLMSTTAPSTPALRFKVSTA